MSQDVLQFQCGACNTTLTVPAQMAGVSGPCPNCGQIVTSPAPRQSAMQPPQWPQAPASHLAPPSVSSPGPSASLMGAGQTAGLGTASGLPPKRAPGQSPLSSNLGSAAGLASTFPDKPGVGGGGGLPSHSRLIPGSPVLPGMNDGTGSSLATGASLLGRDVPPAPLSPQTIPMNPGVVPSLTLGGKSNPPGASPAVPAGRSIASLRAPRGANFLRLAFAALFLIGFIALAGLLLKDYFPGILPGLTGQEEGEVPAGTGSLPSSPQSITKSGAPDVAPAGEGDPLRSAMTKGPGAALTSASSAEGSTSMPPRGFDPTESSTSTQQPAPASPAPALPTTGSASLAEVMPKMPPSAPGPLLEVSSKPATAGETQAPSAPDHGSSSQAQRIAEDDAPPEAKPAVESLRKFLAASSLAERLPHTLGAEHMQPLMERYYSRMADGPVIVDRIQFVRMDPNPELGSGRHCIFSLENKTWEFPVPVMLEEQKDGFKVDWLAFVEFKDRLLEKFFQTYQEGPARFHVGIIRHHYFEDGVPNIERKDAFRVMPAPPNSFQASAFLEKDSALAQELRVRLPWETHVWAVVELEWKKLGSQQWVELSAVPQMHWYSLPMGPRPISTSQKATVTEDMPPGVTKNGARSRAGGKLESGGNMPPPGIQKSSPDLPSTIKRPFPAGR